MKKLFILAGLFLLFFVATANADISEKWESTSNTIVAYDYPVTANVDSDPYLELFVAGLEYETSNSICLCLDGNTGQEQWRRTKTGNGRSLIPIELYDVDNDGIVEVFCAWDSGGIWGMICFNGEDGSTVWENTNLRPGWHHFVIIADRYTNIPYIFVSDHSQTIKKVDARTGEIIDSVSAGLTCNGGLSAADINNDGVVELIQAYHALPGIQCFDTDLNLIWEVNYDVDASTQTPTLIDVNNDGVLDVFVCNQPPGGVGVEFFDGTNGQRIDAISNSNMNIGAHEDSPIWDIDNDDNLEIVCCNNNPVKVVEIGSTGPVIEKDGGMGEWSDSPWMMDIVGDSDMEIVGGQIDYIPRLWDSSYNEITDQPTIWMFPSRGLNDIDNDGLSEIFGCANGNIIVYDTEKSVIDGLNTQTMNFGYRRLDVAVSYPPCPGTAWYSWADWEANQSNQPPHIPSNPVPSDGASGVSITSDLLWSGGDPNGNSVTYDVYFGTSSSPAKVQSNQTSTSYDPGTLNFESTYYWRVVAWDSYDVKTVGPLWDFTTEPEQNNPPYTPSNPDPTNGETNVDINRDIYWTGGDPNGDSVTYDVYFGTGSSPSKVKSNQTSNSYNPGELEYSTVYYWRIVAWDNYDESTVGPVWTFTTEDFVNNAPNVPTNPNPDDNVDDIDVNADLSWYCSDPDGDTIYYDVYFGTNNNPPLIAENHPDPFYVLDTLEFSSTYYWKIVCYDSYGNTNQSAVWSFTTAQEPNNPPVTPPVPVGETVVKCNETINYSTLTTDPDNDDLYYTWSWGDNTDLEIYGPYSSGAPCNVTHQWKTPGIYQIKVKVRDTHYRESSWSTPLNVTAHGLPTVDSGGPYYGFVDEPIEFNGTVKEGFPPYSWSWEFEQNSYSTEEYPVYSYSKAGDYTITVTVSDNRGYESSDNTTCHIAITGDLNVIINTNSKGKTHEPINFTGIVEKGTPPYSLHWDFGDGLNSSMQNPTHFYKKKGIYNVQLIVTDSNGLTGFDNITIDIIDPEEDKYPPTFNIIKPSINSLYFNDEKIIFWLGILVIGDITFEIEANDDYSGIDFVEFYVNDELKSTDYNYPYEWNWNKSGLSKNTIKIFTYDRTGKFCSKELIIWKIF